MTEPSVVRSVIFGEDLLRAGHQSKIIFQFKTTFMFKILFFVLTFPLILKSQINIIQYENQIIGYSIDIPVGFKIEDPINEHIDYKVVSSDGSSILVNISEKTKEEQGIDAHFYSYQMFKEAFEQMNSNLFITQTSKTIIDGKKIFLLYLDSPKDGWNDMKRIEAYLFYGKYAFVITASAGKDNYEKQKGVFLKTIKSLKFK